MPIRNLTHADIPAYLALRAEMLADSPWAFSASPESDVDGPTLAARLDPRSNTILGAFDGGPALVGAAGLNRHRHPKMAHRAHLWGVYVRPASRNQGLASDLIRATLDLARAWPGVDSVSLSVSERSPEARRVYQRLGFVPWGVEPGALRLEGRAYDEIHMVAALSR